MKLIVKYYIQNLMRKPLKFFSVFPIHKNRMVFISLEGGTRCEYSCNPKYFCEYVMKHSPDKYEIVWLMQHPEKYTYLQKKNIRLAKHFSLKGFYYALTSRIVISNGGYFAWFPFRDGQVCINTWHGGGAYKKLENDMPDANIYTKKRMQFAADHMDAFISSNALFTRHVIRGAFLFDKKVLEIGMPRNDLLFSDRRKENIRKHIHEHYQLPAQAKLMLIAPTFREPGSSYPPIDADALLKALESKTGESWYLLMHSHTKAGENPLVTSLTDHCIDVSDYPDSQHLLAASDAMISDYSSIVWDFALTRRPLFLYTPDIDDYTGSRGFYVDVEDWGFPVCRTMDQLLETIDRLPETTYTENSEKHLRLLGSCEDGHACRKLLEYIESREA